MRASFAAATAVGYGGGRRRRLHPAGIVATGPRRRERRRLDRCLGQRGQRRRRRSRDGDVDHERRPSTTRTRSRPAPPTPPRSPTRRWSSTTAATTTTGSSMCSKTTPTCRPSTPTRCGPMPKSPPTSTSSTTRRPPRPSPHRSPTGSSEIDAAHADTYRANAAEFGSQGRRDPDSGAFDRPGTPRRLGGGDRARRALPAGQRGYRRQDPGGLQRTRSRRTPTRRLPTWPRCST